MTDALFYLGELQKLVDVYVNEIISARENGIPEDSPIMQSFLGMNKALHADLEELGRKAKRIYLKYNL